MFLGMGVIRRSNPTRGGSDPGRDETEVGLIGLFGSDTDGRKCSVCRQSCGLHFAHHRIVQV
jgi:hypothetical protein